LSKLRNLHDETGCRFHARGSSVCLLAPRGGSRSACFRRPGTSLGSRHVGGSPLSSTTPQLAHQFAFCIAELHVLPLRTIY
jgi:hypothetical protein